MTVIRLLPPVSTLRIIFQPLHIRRIPGLPTTSLGPVIIEQSICIWPIAHHGDPLLRHRATYTVLTTAEMRDHFGIERIPFAHVCFHMLAVLLEGCSIETVFGGGCDRFRWAREVKSPDAGGRWRFAAVGIRDGVGGT